MSEARFRSDISVKFVQAVGSDLTITRAARVSIDGAGADETPEAMGGLIRYLLKHRHSSPLEHGSLTVLVECPIFVAREWMRHRTFSFNELSGRYRVLEPVFWVPKEGRPIMEPVDFKPARPVLAEGSAVQVYKTLLAIENNARECWGAYARAIKYGVAREVARSMLPVGIYTAFYATANPRNWLAFFSLRTHEADATFVSYPQAEIEDAARQCEVLFAERWPLTHKAFCEAGRMAP